MQDSTRTRDVLTRKTEVAPERQRARRTRHCLIVLGLCVAHSSSTAGWTGADREILRSVHGDERGEVATSVVELDDGGFLVAGYEYDDWDSEWDALILRVAPDGRQLWRHSSDRPGDDYAWVVREAGQDRFVIVGTQSTDAGGTAGFMECIDGEGRQVWRRTYARSGSDVLWAAERAPDGGFFLAGQTEREGAGDLDFLVVRTDMQGHELWSRAFGSPAIERAFGIDLSPDGGVLAAGLQGESEETANILLLRLDAGGNELWRRAITGERFDVAHDVQRIADGGFVVSGYTSSYGPGDQDGFLMRLSADGRMLWMRTYGDTGEDRILHVAPMADGGFALVGYSKHGPAENWDLIVRRVGRNGELVWSHRSGGAHPVLGKDIVAGRDGSVIAVGSSQSEHPPYDDVIILRLSDG